MRWIVFRCLLISIVLASAGVAYGQSDVESSAGKACPFDIAGIWKTQATSITNPIFYNFLQNGWARVLGHSPNTLPQDFEYLTEVQYQVNGSPAPERLEFTAPQSSEVFRRGVTSRDIVEYSDDSFTTIDPETGEQTRWSRVQSRRYFLTLAARRGPLQRGGPAFAMWTTMDGRQTEIEALGIYLIRDQVGGTAPAFGLIPPPLYDEFTHESGKTSDVMLRLEMTETEYQRSHRVFEAWDKHVKSSSLPHGDPYLNVIEFLSRVTDSLNQCGEKVELQKQDGSVANNIPVDQYLAQRPLEYVSMIRKKNNHLHVRDNQFPTDWRPVLLPVGQ